jgi:hypothetical protein
MTYYLIDENLLRTYYENDIIMKYYGKDRPFIISLKNIRYAVDISTLNIYFFYPINRDAYVLTTKGYIKFENSTRYIKNNGRQYFDPITNPKVEDVNKEFTFCSNYICIGELPYNPIKISKDKIVFVSVSFVKTAKELDVQIMENKNELVIDFTKSKIISYVKYIGLKVNETIYLFHDITNYIQLVIPKGTCFKTKHIINDQKYQVVNNFYELCYE